MKKENPPRRTNSDLLLVIAESVGGRFGPLLREQFKQEVLPHLKLSDSAYEELTEEEFQRLAAQIRKETPAFREFLRNIEVKPLPKEWTASQN